MAATANTFARECVMDDLARAFGKDQLEFRLDNIAQQILANVLKSQADKIGWPAKKLQPGHAEVLD